MPKGTNQKLKLYYLGQIMLEHTDEEHYLTLLQIQDYLEEMEVTADRRTLYEDLNELKHLGITVEGEKDGRSYRYHVIEKQFELAELKILVDSIQSSLEMVQDAAADGKNPHWWPGANLELPSARSVAPREYLCL